jgi:hypothetical protein
MCETCRYFDKLSILGYGKFNCKQFRLIGICANKDSEHHMHVLSKDHPKCICCGRDNDNREINRTP